VNAELVCSKEFAPLLRKVEILVRKFTRRLRCSYIMAEALVVINIESAAGVGAYDRVQALVFAFTRLDVPVLIVIRSRDIEMVQLFGIPWIAEKGKFAVGVDDAYADVWRGNKHFGVHVGRFLFLNNLEVVVRFKGRVGSQYVAKVRLRYLLLKSLIQVCTA
jgi:hypothetical protein